MDNKIKNPLTIKAVAKLAGVTPALVSRVINDDITLSIRAETRDRIIQAIEELNYKPNLVARSLRTKSTNMIAMIVPDISNPFFTKIIKGVQDSIAEKDFFLILCNTEESALKEKKYVDILSKKQIDGIILASIYIKDEIIDLIQEYNIPYVLVNRTFKNASGPFVIFDDIGGAIKAVQYLIDLKHIKIAHIAGLLYTETAICRLKGYTTTLKKNNIDVFPEFIVESSFTEEGGNKAMKKLLALSIIPTAIFAANDLIAFGAIDAIRQYGLRVPEDISIVGFNDIWLAQRSYPPLTTVRCPLYDMGYLSGGLLINKINKVNQEDEITLKTNLIVRGSTSPAS